ncbi:MAG: RHS repeat domain-containing protein [Kordia sp.]|uniref:RHS repeat domain-containing protein n=1 Tax=Kordia sp. TaxID=1965332 RepID=UPI003858902C
MFLVTDVHISYIYDAFGAKQQKIVNDQSNENVQQTHYAGNYIYKKATAQASLALTFFNSEEGYVEPQFDPSKPEKITGFNYTYQYKDHLGNIRLSYEDIDGNGNIKPETEIKEENHYYPFGLKHKGYNANQVGRDHQYGYNGKEENDELGLELLDYGNRNYEASLGRFITVDRFSQKYLDKSPYHYGANNPVLYVDKKGDSIIVSTKERLYDGIEGKNIATVKKIDDLGSTNLVDGSTSWKYNETTKEVDATFYIQQEFSPFLKPGDSNKFVRKNRGIGKEIEAHEDGHVEQISETILDKKRDFAVTIESYGGKRNYRGDVQDILNKVYKDYEIDLEKALEDVKTDNPFNLTNEQVIEDQKAILNVNMKSALNQLEKFVKARYVKFNASDPGHSDANNRAYKILKGRMQYNNGIRKIKYL